MAASGNSLLKKQGRSTGCIVESQQEHFSRKIQTKRQQTRLPRQAEVFLRSKADAKAKAPWKFTATVQLQASPCAHLGRR